MWPLFPGHGVVHNFSPLGFEPQTSGTGASKLGTPGDAECITEILGDKNKEVRGDKFIFFF